jgi:hypothetical protein
MCQPKLSKRYRAIADLYAYLESRGLEDFCFVVDNGDALDIEESLYKQLSENSETKQLLYALIACDVAFYRYSFNP